MTAYNEEAVIANTVRDCITVLNQIPGAHTILAVNDGSTDRTGEILQNLAAQYPQLRVLVHPENRGVAQAQRWLIREAQGDLIFHMAADGEWRASELHGLLAKLSQGYDIVIGVRRHKHYSAYRKGVSWLYNMLTLVLFRKNLRDIGSIKLVRAELWKRLPAESKSAFFLPEKILLASRNRARIGFVPVDHVWRATGRSKFNNPLRALEAFVELVQFWWSPRSRQRLALWEDEPEPQRPVQSGRGSWRFQLGGKGAPRWGRAKQ
jgi:glycosyltransferase involved in cell wall biosynthesis